MAKATVVQKNGGPTSKKYGGPKSPSSDQEMWGQEGHIDIKTITQKFIKIEFDRIDRNRHSELVR